MGSSQSQPETDTSSITLESGADGETKIIKRNLSQEELNELTELIYDEDGSVTIDQAIINAIAVDMGLPLEEEKEEEEEEEEYEEMFLVDPIETPDNLMPGMHTDLGTDSTNWIELGQPIISENSTNEPEPPRETVPELEAVAEFAVEPVAAEVEEPVVEAAVVDEPVAVVEPVIVEVDPVAVEDAEPVAVIEPTVEELAVTEETEITEAAPAPAVTGIISYIAKAVEPLFNTPTRDVPAESHQEPKPGILPQEPAAKPKESAPKPPQEPELLRTEKLANSLFGEFKKQEVEKIILEAKLDGARHQAKLDADVMTATLNAERSRWRSKFSVIEENLQKRKREIGSAHEEGTKLISSKINLPEPKDSCKDTISEIMDCYSSNPDHVLRCKDLVQTFDSCVSSALTSR